MPDRADAKGRRQVMPTGRIASTPHRWLIIKRMSPSRQPQLICDGRDQPKKTESAVQSRSSGAYARDGAPRRRGSACDFHLSFETRVD
jgi:hypothetical protein